jgi:protein ImuB
MRWIAIHLPQLPLEIFLRGAPAPEPFAVADSRGFILACDRKAAARGIAPGMAAPAALALAGRLVVCARDPAAETEAVLGIAAWAGQFTPTVVVNLPDGVLLEVEGSLQLFGGLQKILDALQAGLTDIGYTARLASAPVPQAAAWMAQAAAWLAPARAPSPPQAQPIPVATDETLPATVAALPLDVLRGMPGIAGDNLDALRSLGIDTLGRLQALPRDGVARRFGQPLLDTLDRGLGRLADPRTAFRLPERFRAGLELPAEVSQTEALIFAARRLLVQLAGFLAARSGGVQRIVVKLAHRQAATEVPIGLVAPSRDAAHFTLLLRERLAALVLREPVRSISVVADDILPLAGEALGLFASDAIEPGSWDKLVERLRARLGEEAVQGIAPTNEHRPERAALMQAMAATKNATSSTRTPRPAQSSRTAQPRLPLEEAPPGERPFWLLEAPRPIREVGSVPHHEGPLELLAGPERIETGWWDSGEIARDYFVARSPAQSLLWIYRERRPPEAGAGWYLHGIFA